MNERKTKPYIAMSEAAESVWEEIEKEANPTLLQSVDANTSFLVLPDDLSTTGTRIMIRSSIQYPLS